MKLFNSTINFKGYDAVPLKNIYLEKSHCGNVIEEISNVAKQEGIEFLTQYDSSKWMQDNKTFILKDKKLCLIARKDVSLTFLSHTEDERTIETIYPSKFLTGGNIFLGNFPNGERWLLTGYDNQVGLGNSSSVSKYYQVKSKNIFNVPQQNYHLDMFLRPVGYPYVLVNDFDCVEENVEKLNDGSKNYQDFAHKVKHHIRSQKTQYDSFGETKDVLESHGFVVIPIAGDYDLSVNFMNAIVNKHKNGTLSYITNSSKCSNPYLSRLEEFFEDDLKKKVPNLEKIYFIKGKSFSNVCYGNYMMDTLRHQGGGIHCLTLEEPDFDVMA